MRRGKSLYEWVVLLENVQKLGCDQSVIISKQLSVYLASSRMFDPYCSRETAQQPILIDWWFNRRMNIKQVDLTGECVLGKASL